MPRPPRATESPEGMPLLLAMHDYEPDPDLDGRNCICQLPRHNRHHHDAFLGTAPQFPPTPSPTNAPW